MMNLPEPGAPLILADGTQIDPSTGKAVRSNVMEVPNNKELREHYVAVQRRLVDLPLPPSKMNAISILVMYKLIGLSNDEIGVATGLEENKVSQLLMSDAFMDMQKMVIDSIHEADASDIRAMMKKNALNGVRKMGELVMSDDEFVALAASKDSLDREGYRPVDVVEHRHKLDGGLKIEIVQRNHSNTDDAIPVDFKDVTE